MKFSICIPNYNYAKYLGATIQSVLDQSYEDFEIVIADNASTDQSVDVVRGFSDPRIKLRVNACNVGFAGNLDRAGRMATGDYMILLSSDDLMRPGALSTYAALLEEVGSRRGVVITSSQDVVDDGGAVTGHMELLNSVRPSDRDEALSARFGFPVSKAPAREMLTRSLQRLKNPFFFCPTAYPRELYERIEGYGGARSTNPDKWFHWRLCTVAGDVYYLAHPFFAWRFHPKNQTAQEGDALKYVVDDYLSTLEFDAKALADLGLTRQDLSAAYAENLIGLQGLAWLARHGDRRRARRILTFGRAVYPREVRSNAKARLLAALLATGPLAPPLARAIRFAKNRGKPVPPTPWKTA